MDRVAFYRPNIPNIQTISKAVLYMTGFSSEEEIEETVEKGLGGKDIDLLEPSNELKIKPPFLSDDSGYVIKSNDYIRYIWCNLNGKRMYEPIPYRVDIMDTDSILTTPEQDMCLSLHNHISVSMHNSIVDRCNDPMSLIQRIHNGIESFDNYKERVQMIIVDHTGNIPQMEKLHHDYKKYLKVLTKPVKFYVGFKSLKGNSLDLKYAKFQEGKVVLTNLEMIGSEVVI